MIFDKIKAAQGTNDKMKIATEEFTSLEHDFMEVCFNNVVYGISGKGIQKAIGYDESLFGKCEDLGEFVEKLNEKQFSDRFETEYTSDYSIGEELKQLIDDLQRYSGNEQIKILRLGLKLFDKQTMPWIIRAISKNMRIGFSLASYNKVRKAHNLPLIEGFGVQLCGKLEVTRENFVQLSYPRMCEYKYDGVRCIIDIKGENITLIARSGDDITEHYPEVIQGLKNKFINNSIKHLKLDCEIISKDFIKLSTRMHRKAENIQEVDSDLHPVIFDILYCDLDLTFITQKERREILEDLSKRFDLELSYMKIVNNVDELLEFYKFARDINQEGVVTKDFDMHWIPSSRAGWVKMIPKESLDLKIIDAYVGNGKNSKFINGVIVENKDKTIRSKASSGISDDNRELLTELHRKGELIGKICEISYREISKTKNGLSLRFPVFKRLREDKLEAD